MESVSDFCFDCEGMDTKTSSEQCRCEVECSKFLAAFSSYPKQEIDRFKVNGFLNEDTEICMLRDMHFIYLTSGLEKLSSDFVSLDSSRPWICYWILHGLHLLDKEPRYLYDRVISSLSKMENLSGGFGGGPAQLSHGAPTYAAVLALCTIGTEEALSSINRRAMYNFFLTMKHQSGGFSIHRDGEVDSRSTYTIISIARILNILTPPLVSGVADYVLKCQSYEGGFGGEPGNEAHGGYNFCALATLLILGKAQLCDVKGLEWWLLQRQMKLEGGFQGRTNKLVDSCYSFWQGASLAMVNVIKNGGNDLYDMEQYMLSHNGSGVETGSHGGSPSPTLADTARSSCDLPAVAAGTDLEIVESDCSVRRITPSRPSSGLLSFNQEALQRYILHCGQDTNRGGLKDKPGKSRDFYHSCYALSGMSIAQQAGAPLDSLHVDEVPQVYGDVGNLLAPTSCVYNIGLEKLHFAIQYFQKFSLPT